MPLMCGRDVVEMVKRKVQSRYMRKCHQPVAVNATNAHTKASSSSNAFHSDSTDNNVVHSLFLSHVTHILCP